MNSILIVKAELKPAGVLLQWICSPRVHGVTSVELVIVSLLR